MRFFKKADRAAIADERAMKKRKKRAAKAARRMPRDRYSSDDVPITMTIRETHEQLYIEPDNAQTIGMREEQQDAFIFSNVYSDDDNADIGCVAVLADGMGGLADGYTAASTGVEEFLNVYSSEVKDGELTLAAMEDAVYSANRAVCRIGNSGATLIGAVVRDKELCWVSVGDSHIYLMRNGMLRQLNVDHIYARELDEMACRGEITFQEAASNYEREALTSYLGLDTLSEIDKNERRFPLRMGDIILLCSDGVYKTLGNDEIEMILSNSKRRTAQALINAVEQKQRAAQDNATAVIFKII